MPAGLLRRALPRPPGAWGGAAPGAGRRNRASAADWSPRGIETARKPQPAAEMAAEISPEHHLRPEGEGCPAVGPGESLSPESERRSAVLPAAPKVAPLVPRTENPMTKRLLVTAVVSLGATAPAFAPSTHLGGLPGVAPARAATSAAAVPADADSGMDDSAVGALDQAGLGGPVDAAGAAPADGPIDADAPADPAPADAAPADPGPAGAAARGAGAPRRAAPRARRPPRRRPPPPAPPHPGPRRPGARGPCR